MASQLSPLRLIQRENRGFSSLYLVSSESQIAAKTRQEMAILTISLTTAYRLCVCIWEVRI